jgi:hypothetical protein
VIFATSQTFMTGAIGGRAAADHICQTAATGAGLPGTFVAYLSTQGGFDGGAAVNAASLVANARGWVRTDGLPVADKPSQLTSGSLWYPVDHDENGNRITTTLSVMTGTDGSGNVVTGGTCGDWTESTGAVQQNAGLVSAGTAAWTNWTEQACTLPGRLYCLQTSQNVAVTVPATQGRTMFVTSVGWDTSTGLAGADALCASDAKGANLSGTFLALLPTDTASAISRFDTTGTPWIRVDGVPIVAQASDMATYSLLAPACLSSKGAYETYGGAISGSTSISMAATDANDCVGWTTKVSPNKVMLTRTDATIVPGYTNAFGDLGATWSCGTNWPIICMQP